MDGIILDDVKKVIGFDPDYKEFDQDLLLHINSVFSILTQRGVGPSEGFEISGDTEEWSDFVDDKRVNMVKTYICLKVRLLFDSSTMTSYAINALNDQAKEYEWRLQVASEDEINQ
mgnify:FL=1